MKGRQYRLTFKGVARRSFGIWFSLIGYFAFVIFLMTGNGIDVLGGMIIWNFFSFFIIFPGLYIQLNYIIKSRGSVVEIGKDTVLTKKGETEIVIKIEEIKDILQFNSWRWSRLPWWNHYYYRIIDLNNNKVDINLYSFKDGEIWQNTGLRKIQDEKLKRIEVFLPLIRKNDTTTRNKKHRAESAKFEQHNI